MLFKLSNLNSNLALTLGYLNPALNNSALAFILQPLPVVRKFFLLGIYMDILFFPVPLSTLIN